MDNLDRESELRGDDDSSHSWLEFKVPLILLSIGLIALVGSAIHLAGADGIRLAAFYVGTVLVVQVPLTIVGMYILGSMLGISYGVLKSAVLKLAAIQIVVAGIMITGAAMGHGALAIFILGPIASWALFAILFDLDVWETLISAIGLWLLGLALKTLLDSFA